MRQVLILAAVAALASMLISCGTAAAEFTGHIVDAKCAGGGKAGGPHSECAKKCIEGGEAAVLVTADGTVYEITNQDKVTPHAGLQVTISGSEADGKITADSVAATS